MSLSLPPTTNAPAIVPTAGRWDVSSRGYWAHHRPDHRCVPCAVVDQSKGSTSSWPVSSERNESSGWKSRGAWKKSRTNRSGAETASSNSRSSTRAGNPALDRVRLVMPRQPLVPGGTNLMIEEILFPGYEVVAPAPRRHFPDLVLRSVEFDGRTLTARGNGIAPGEALLVAGRRIPAQVVWGGGQLQARLSPGQWIPGRQVEIKLVNRYRQSNPQTLK